MSGHWSYRQIFDRRGIWLQASGCKSSVGWDTDYHDFQDLS